MIFIITWHMLKTGTSTNNTMQAPTTQKIVVLELFSTSDTISVRFILYTGDSLIYGEVFRLQDHQKMFQCTSCSKRSETNHKCACGSFSFYYIARCRNVVKSD